MTAPGREAPMLAFAAGILLPSALAIGAILVRTRGHFAYPLDGPYIHLAMADQILRGHYGVNAGEAASPSSTILYPYLLAVLGVLRFGQGSALAVCLAANAASAVLLFRLAEECAVPLRMVAPAWLVMLGASLALATNLVGLSLSGLEHALHVTLTLAALLGMVRFIHRRQVDWWWLGAILLLPLIRFEGMTAVRADALVLLVWRKWWHALGITLATAVCIGGFGLYLHSLGLPWLPQSIVERSIVAGAGMQLEETGLLALIRSVYTNIRVNILAYGGTHIAVAAVALGWGAAQGWAGAWHGRRDQARIAAAGFFILVGLAQVAGGSLVSVSRYEIYVIVLALGALLVVFDQPVAALLRRLGPLTSGALCLSILLVGAGYALRTVDAVKASTTMHEMDDELARFVVDYYRGPVAVARFGRLNYRNPYPVTGLPAADPRVPEAVTAARADALVRQRGIGLAMLPDTMMPRIPPGWVPVARLLPLHPGPEARDVTFYAIRPETAGPILDALGRFAPTLPGRVLLGPGEPAGVVLPKSTTRFSNQRLLHSNKADNGKNATIGSLRPMVGWAALQPWRQAMIDPPIPQPPRTLGPHQDRDGPAYEAASPPLAGLVSRMILQGWTQHEAHYAMLTFAVRRIARAAREMGTPEAMGALLDLPEQVGEQIDFQLAASNGSLPVIPGWQ